MNLGEYLLAGGATPWDPGVHDCTAWPARWAGIATPAYSNDEEGERLIAEAGGLLPLWSHWIGSTLRRVSEPLAGDIGIIRAVGRDGRTCDIGAIYNGRRWSFLLPQGLAGANAETVAVWRVPCPRQ